jgi:hypothetical protein
MDGFNNALIECAPEIYPSSGYNINYWLIIYYCYLLTVCVTYIACIVNEDIIFEAIDHWINLWNIFLNLLVQLLLGPLGIRIFLV